MALNLGDRGRREQQTHSSGKTDDHCATCLNTNGTGSRAACWIGSCCSTGGTRRVWTSDDCNLSVA
jgi:hypothetical protein